MVKVNIQTSTPYSKVPRGKAFKIAKKKKANTKLLKDVALKEILPKLEPKKQQQAGEGANKTEPTDIKPVILRKDIESAIRAVLKLRKMNPKFKNQLIHDPFYLKLQISCHRVPQGHSTLLRIPFPHSPYPRDSDVCIIVADLKGVPRKDHERHVEHYEELFERKGVKGIKKIMTFHELQTEYETFELKDRLADLYDVFLSDSTICGKVMKHVGKKFYMKHKVPNPVKLYLPKLKEHLEKQLRKSVLHVHLKGNSYSVKFGNSEMDVDALVENVQSAVEFLGRSFPGRMDNISGIHVYTFRTTSIPIYLSGKSPRDVPTPKIPEKLPKAYKTYQGELTTFPDMEVVVKPTGDIKVIRTAEGDEDSGRKKKKKTSLAVGNKKTKGTVDKKKGNALANGTEDQGISKKKKKGSVPENGTEVQGVSKKKKKGNIAENGTEDEGVSKKKKKSIASENGTGGQDVSKKKRKVAAEGEESVEGSKKLKKGKKEVFQKPEKAKRGVGDEGQTAKKTKTVGRYVKAPKI